MLDFCIFAGQGSELKFSCIEAFNVNMILPVVSTVIITKPLLSIFCIGKFSDTIHRHDHSYFYQIRPLILQENALQKSNVVSDFLGHLF